MSKRFSLARQVLWASLPLVAALFADQAQAVPSYARQTGQDCAACHIGAFGPQLTPFGIKFKLGGYVDSDGKGGKIPLSAMVVADYSRYKPQDPDTGTFGDKETKSGIAEASVFLAGKLTDHIGSFVQVTNSGIDHTTSFDQMDLRVTTNLNMGDKEALVGVSVNNNPTVQDPFNTLSTWGFPYTGSDRLSYPGSELASGSLEHRVIGVNAYTLIDDSIYAELGLYNTLSPAMQSRMGQGRFNSDAADPGTPFGSLSNAPYWRLAYTKDLHTSAWHVGLMGYDGKVEDRVSTDSVKFKDIGVDGSYTFLGNRQHICTLNASYLREHTNTVSEADGDSSDTTKDLRLSTSYHYMNTYGATFGYVKSSSKSKETGNRAFIYQLDWTPWGKESSWNAPWANVRLGAQYVAFKSDIATEANGGKASDLNSLRLFAWTSF
ncbi:MAG: cytochrome C [Aquabacterium sp.]|uniref:hypothetical protein n=1 Tax=Aquabacterium sp. TaxID=1872578 RepID=UPI001213D386|nr:hypothetical protein [Aquabacterium sp.]TAK95720.1 MAG: cytochrome C [Aquabacterium sp.]